MSKKIKKQENAAGEKGLKGVYSSMTLRQKFTIPSGILLFLCFSLFIGYLIIDQSAKNSRELNQTSVRLSSIIAHTNVENVWNFNTDGLNNTCSEFLKDNSVSRIVIVSASGDKLIDLNKNIKGKQDFVKKTDIIREKQAIASLQITFTSAYLDEEFASIRNRLILLFVAVFIIVIGGITLISRTVLSPLDAMMKMIERFSKKDLSGNIVITNNDEIGRLGVFVNNFIDNLRSIITSMKEAGDTLNVSAVQLNMMMDSISKGNSDKDLTVHTLLKGLERVMDSIREQTAATEEASAAVVEMSDSISSVSQNAASTKSLSSEANNEARTGGDAVKKTRNGINTIEEIVHDIEKSSIALGDSSSKIGGILSVISDISEQTNLLALNAAIEAARAGDSGKGFAVVADEVQKLAGHSQTATKEIDLLIKNIDIQISGVIKKIKTAYEQVHAGAGLAQEAEKYLTSIIARTSSTNNEITQIASSMEEQVIGIGELMETIVHITASSENIEHMSHQQVDGLNEIIAVVNKVSSASKNLSDISDQLNGIVGEFKLS